MFATRYVILEATYQILHVYHSSGNPHSSCVKPRPHAGNARQPTGMTGLLRLDRYLPCLLRLVPAHLGASEFFYVRSGGYRTKQ